MFTCVSVCVCEEENHQRNDPSGSKHIQWEKAIWRTELDEKRASKQLIRALPGKDDDGL